MKSLPIILALMLLTISPVLGASTADATAPTPAERPMSPMMAEIVAAVDASHLAVAELSREIAQTTDQGEVLALQREVSRLKNEMRLETLRIQLRYAEAEGRTEAVATLERLLAGPTAARAGDRPVRPAPATAGRR